jgi:hypothetical protein
MKERVSKARLFQDLPRMDKKKRRAKERERECKISVLAWAMCYMSAFVFPQPPQVSKH